MHTRRTPFWLALVILLSLPTFALAHVHLEKSTPAKDETLAAAPTSVQLWFSGNIETAWSKVEVTDANGNRVDKNNVSAINDNASSLQIDLTPLSSGSYTVKWNAVANDGHRIKGNIIFHVK